MSNYTAASFGPFVMSLTELIFDDGLFTPNLITTEGFSTPFGAGLTIKGNVLYAQVSESGGYSSTPIYGYSALRTSNDVLNPGVFEFGNHGVLTNNVSLSINLLNGTVKIPSLAAGAVSLVTSDTDGNLIPQGELQEFADNTSALTAGKTAGQFYRTGEFVKVVF